TDRRRDNPLMVPAGDGRWAACDVLAFTPDGEHLFAAGDDKVVHCWKVAADPSGKPVHKQLLPLDHLLRWSAYRQLQGNIYAAALDPSGKRVAVAGVGLPQGSVAVLNRDSGKVEHTGMLPTVTAIWQAAWGPDDQIVFGSESGELWLWELNKPKNEGIHLLGP